MKHTTRISLADKTPFAAGKWNVVYRHPDDPDVLIKLPQPERIDYYRQNPPMRLQASFLHRHLKHNFRELREIMAIMAKWDHYPSRLQKFYGFVDTDLGVGRLVELKKGADGNPAPTLSRLIRDGRYYEPEIQRSLESFLDWLRSTDITICDLRTDNLVYALDETGNTEFALIDGIGEPGRLQFNSTFPFLNAAYKRRHIRRLHLKMEAECRKYGTEP